MLGVGKFVDSVDEERRTLDRGNAFMLQDGLGTGDKGRVGLVIEGGRYGFKPKLEFALLAAIISSRRNISAYLMRFHPLYIYLYIY